MSAALRAAIAAKRAALKQPTASSATASQQGGANDDNDGAGGGDDALSPSSSTDELALDSLSLAQPPLTTLLLKSCSTGKLILSSRSPELVKLPQQLFDLLAEAPPAWYKGARPWYERADLTSLNVANNALEECQDALEQFTALQRVDLHNNRLTTLPSSLAHLSNLTHLNLSGNQLVSFPAALLALDTLLELDLSTNRLEALWSAEDVASSRAQLQVWSVENREKEEGGVWAGFMAGQASNQQRGGRGGGRKVDTSYPLANLRTLSLANNRLLNTSLGLASVAGAEAPQGVEQVRLPQNLTTLDLSDNFLRGPLPLELFGRLQSLAVLDLGGNGLSLVFDSSSSTSSDSSSNDAAPLFPALHTLDIHRCEIDDLAPLEATFGSPRAIAPGEKPHLAGASVASPPAGLKARQLVCAATRRPAGSEPFRSSTTTTGGGGAALFVILEGNPLREEAFRRKRTATNPGSNKAMRGVSNEVMRAASSSSTAEVPKKAEVRNEREEEIRKSRLGKAPVRKRGAHNESCLDEFGALGERTERKMTVVAAREVPKQAEKVSEREAVPETMEVAAAAKTAPIRTKRRGAGMEQSAEMWGALGGDAPPSASRAAAPQSAPTSSVKTTTAAATPAAKATGGMSDWEAPLSEGAKRRMRAEAARKAAEEEALASGGAGGTGAASASGGNAGRGIRERKVESEWGPL